MYNWFGFGDFDHFFKIIWEFILQMMLSFKPMVYLFDNTKPVFGFGDLDPIFRVTGEFSLKCLGPVN